MPLQKTRTPPSEQTSNPSSPQGNATIFDVLARLLGHIPGGRVLDVATGRGGFVGILTKSLKDYVEIVGIDSSREAIRTAQDAHDAHSIRFVQMDAGHLDFADESFDTVSVAVSLHHFANVPQILAEAKRVLKPGGYCIIVEMHRDVQTEPQRTVVQIHHWAAEIDTARGVAHNPTLARQEIVAFVAGLGLRDLALYDYADLDADPQDKAAIKGSQDAIDIVVQRAEGLPDYEAFKQRAEALRRRIREVGVQREPVLIAVGQKKSALTPAL